MVIIQSIRDNSPIVRYNGDNVEKLPLSQVALGGSTSFHGWFDTRSCFN